MTIQVDRYRWAGSSALNCSCTELYSIHALAKFGNMGGLLVTSLKLYITLHTTFTWYVGIAPESEKLKENL